MISYILFNTLIYGSIAFILSTYFGYGKYLNVAVGSFMILGTYTILHILQVGRSRAAVCTIAVMILLYWAINTIVLYYFRNEKQRDLFGLIFTLGASILLENMTTIIYGPSPVSTTMRTIDPWMLAVILVVINVIIIYTFHKSYLGKIRKGIYSNISSIRSLGIHTNRMIHRLSIAFIPGLVLLGLLIANEGSLRPGDNLFYLIKGIGIMIMIGLEKKEYIYLGALVYVALEYIIFIGLGMPIQYKETLILVIILAILLIKPEGLLSIRSRKL